MVSRSLLVEGILSIEFYRKPFIPDPIIHFMVTDSVSALWRTEHNDEGILWRQTDVTGRKENGLKC